jgi:aminoacrylate hydrolase
VIALRYEVFGRKRDDAETVLLCAGLGGMGAFWRPQIEALADRYHVIAYDQRGTGANSEPLRDGYRIVDMAQDVVGILDQAGVSRAHFMGHALGGLVGLQLGRTAPERLSSLILVNAWAKVDSHTRRCFAARLALLDHVGPEAYVRAQPIFLYPAAWLSAHEKRMEIDDAHGIAHFQGAGALKTRVEALLAFDISDRLGEIATPTLVMATRDDILVPYTCSEFMASKLPRARLWLTSEGGHASSVTESAAFNAALLGFLGEVARG